jgi:uncharacterized OsmC-like protein
MAAERVVSTRWEGGMRAVSRAGDFELVVDEPKESGGTNTGPQPTDLFLASVSSCYVLALAFVARRRGVELVDLKVTATGRYDGLQFDQIGLAITSASPRAVVVDLLDEALRLCYVSNTLRRQPRLTVEVCP